DLARLKPFVGVAGLGGSVMAQARVEKTRTHLHVDLDAHALRLRAGGNEIGRLDVKVHEKDFIGRALVTVVGLRAGNFILDSLKRDASGDPRAVKVALAARGPEATAVDLQLHGTPTLARHAGGVEGVKITGADLTLDQLAMARHQQRWATTGPATIRV